MKLSARVGESNAKLSARVGESKIPLITGKIREVWQIVNVRPSFLYIAIVNYKIPPPLRRGIKGVGRFWIASGERLCNDKKKDITFAMTRIFAMTKFYF